MGEFNVGDKVRFTEDKDNHVLTVAYLTEDGSGIELMEFEDTYFSAEAFTLVKRCPYENDEKIKLTAVFWNDEKKTFQMREVVGTFKDGYIDFQKRTYDHFGVFVYHLNSVRTGEMAGVDYDCAFCEPGEENIRKVKLEYLRMMTRKVEDLKEDYGTANSQLMAMRQQIGV